MAVISEASRQYQAVLEAERATRLEFGGTLSAQDILRDAQTELSLAEEYLVRVWRDWARGKLG